MPPKLDHQDLREELQERLERAKERLRSVEAEATRLKRLIAGLKDVLATLDQEGLQLSEGLPFKDLPPPSPRSALATMSIKDAACSVLAQQQRPMSVRELYDALAAGGKIVGGKTPTETLRAVLNRYDSDFRRMPDAKWILADEPQEQET